MSGEKSRVLKIVAVIGLVLGGMALFVLVAFMVGYFVMLLWNWLMPAIFGLPEITYWQAWGILILAQILFGRSLSSNPKDKRSGNDGHDTKRLKQAFTRWLEERERELPKEDDTHAGKEVTA